VIRLDSLQNLIVLFYWSNTVNDDVMNNVMNYTAEPDNGFYWGMTFIIDYEIVMVMLNLKILKSIHMILT
jgi:hypothetical protein